MGTRYAHRGAGLIIQLEIYGTFGNASVVPNQSAQMMTFLLCDAVFAVWEYYPGANFNH